MAKEMGRKVLDEGAFEEAQKEIALTPHSAMGPRVLANSPDSEVTQPEVEDKPEDLNNPVGPVFEETGFNQMGPHYLEAAPKAPPGTMKADEVGAYLRENPEAVDAVLIVELDRPDGPRVTVLRQLLAAEKKKAEPRQDTIEQIEALIEAESDEEE
jgi:hypothetical protein